MLEAELFGHIAALVQQMGKKEHEQEEKQDIVNSAIKNLKIPEKLQLEIDGYLAFTQSHLESQEEFKSFIKLISPSIKDQVIYHIFSETLKEHSSIELGSLLIDKLSQRLKVHTYSPEEEITVQGHDGDSLFVIAKGECLVVVRDHLSIDEPVRIIKQGDIFGEVALIQNCKRTATVKTNNFSLVASLNKKDFKELSHQFKEFVPKLKQKMKSYDDNLKRFLISIVKIIPFMKDLPIEVEETASYFLNQSFYNKGDVIFKEKEDIDKVIIVSKGRIELCYNIEDQETAIHYLTPGAHIGGYQIHGNYQHVFTAKAHTKVTVHYITKTDFKNLIKNTPELKSRFERLNKFLKATKNPIMSFGYFRDRSK